MRVSHGCIRLYPEDIAELFEKVKVGTVVNIINSPYKIGEEDGVLYLEAHPPLKIGIKDEYGDIVDTIDTSSGENFTRVVEMIVASTEEDEYVIDWGMAKIVSEEAKGIPVAIGIHIPKQAESRAEVKDEEDIN